MPPFVVFVSGCPHSRRASGTGALQGLECEYSDTLKLDAASDPGSLIRRVE
jgi:hypothetical protein